VFVVAGMFAFPGSNIEAYPIRRRDPGDHRAIAGQSRGDGALFHHPDRSRACRDASVDVIRRRLLWLSFVRVVFQYNVDYYFALTQTAINLQQNVNLPNNVVAQIQGTSLVGEIYRYQLVGAAFG